MLCGVIRRHLAKSINRFLSMYLILNNKRQPTKIPLKDRKKKQSAVRRAAVYLGNQTGHLVAIELV